MGGLECVITGLTDEFHEIFAKNRVSREVFTAFVVFSSFLIALSCVTPVKLILDCSFKNTFVLIFSSSFKGGIYVFNLLETYVAGLSLLATVFFEAIAISWVYGMENFKSDVNRMLGHTPNMYWRVCWKIISPAFLGVSFSFHFFFDRC